MSPIVHGTLYPEIQSSFLFRNIFRILVDNSFSTKESRPYLVKIATFVAYLRGISGRDCQIELVYIENNDRSPLATLLDPFGATRVPTAEDIFPHVEEEMSDADAQWKLIVSTALRVDADCIVTTDQPKLDSGRDLAGKLSLTVEDWESALVSCEVFCRGHDIPWSFSSPIWGCPFGTFYTMVEPYPSLVELHRIFVEKIDNNRLDTEIVEYTRSLAYPRMANLCYARDKLLFYSQQRRAAKRARLIRQNFWFEAGYHLNHYYLLLWGGVDQMCWVIAETFGLDYSLSNRNDWNQVGPTKVRYLGKLETHSPTLHTYFTTDEFLKWFKMLREVRHYAAHNGTIIPRRLPIESDETMTEEELEQAVQADSRFENIQELETTGIITPTEAERNRNDLRILKQTELLEEIHDDVLQVELEGENVLITPLLNVQWDFDNYIQFVETCTQECVSQLGKA